MPTYELPAAVEEILDAERVCFEAGQAGCTEPPEDAARVLNAAEAEMRELAIYPAFKQMALARAPHVAVAGIKLVFQALFSAYLSGFEIGRIYGRLETPDGD